MRLHWTLTHTEDGQQCDTRVYMLLSDRMEYSDTVYHCIYFDTIRNPPYTCIQGIEFVRHFCFLINGFSGGSGMLSR